MNGLLLVCSIAILATVHAIPPGLSESFYLQATGTRTSNISGTVTITDFSRYNYAADTARLLAFIEIIGTTNGVGESSILFSSVNDNLTYIDANGTCVTIPNTDPDSISGLLNLLFEDFTTGIEDPAGTITYTFTQSQGFTRILITVNGLPTSLTTTSLTSTLILDIFSYTNSAPPFSIFVLPDACSNFTCDFCCSTAAGVASSFLLMLAALVMFLFSTV